MATGLSPEELQRAKDACAAAGYEFEKELGRGAFGVVYKVRREGTDFAIKILSKALFSSPAIKPVRQFFFFNFLFVSAKKNNTKKQKKTTNNSKLHNCHNPNTHPTFSFLVFGSRDATPEGYRTS